MKFSSAPAWSIPARRQLRRKGDNPGPGAYDSLSSSLSRIATKVGTGPRSDIAKRAINTPGPGTYDLANDRPTTGSAVFGSSQKFPIARKDENPGPGAYTVQSTDPPGPKWGFKGKGKTQNKEEKPGPGTYNCESVDSLLEHNPAWSFPKSKSMAGLKMGGVPGPGEYPVQVRDKSPAWAFGTGTKGLVDKNKDFPAPGKYEIPDTLDKRSFSMSGKHPDLTRKYLEHVPGPGTYSPPTHSKGPSFSVGHGSRLKESAYKLQTPGPDAYDPEMRPNTSAAILGTSQRPGILLSSVAPGPGKYSVLKKEIEGPKFSFAGRHQLKPQTNTPGPGHYDLLSSSITLDRPISAILGTSKRDDSPEKLNMTMPGPGMYDIRDGMSRVGYRFGTDVRKFGKASINPGPGTYELTPTKSAKGIFIAGKHPDISHKEVPGPGAYTVTDGRSTNTPAYSISRGGRSSLVKTANVPGPGHYSLSDDMRGPGVKIGKESREFNKRRDVSPGPGAYEQLRAVPEGPKYSLRTKYYQTRKSENPGPGHYNPDGDVSLQKAPVVRFGKESREVSTEQKSVDSVGPGMYYTPPKARPPIWSFGTQQRGSALRSGSPGPGAYDLKPTVPDVASYALKNK